MILGPAFALQAFCTFALTGLIWLVQLVHYPSFLFVSEAEFARFHRFHSRQISWIVIPLMTLELGGAILLSFSLPRLLWGTNLLLAILPWAFTFLLSVPAHNALGIKFDPATAKKLIATNWARTAAWSAKSALLLWMMSQ